MRVWKVAWFGCEDFPKEKTKVVIFDLA